VLFIFNTRLSWSAVLRRVMVDCPTGPLGSSFSRFSLGQSLVDLADPGHRFFTLDDDHVHHRLARWRERLGLALDGHHVGV
jgi:hypothetical protein